MERWIGMILAGGLLVSGCNGKSPTDQVCPGEAVPAMEVEVVESVSNEPILTPLVISIQGSQVDTLAVHQNKAYGPLARTGVFSLRVEKEGYQTWTLDGVLVEEGLCGQPTTTHFTAELVGL